VEKPRNKGITKKVWKYSNNKKKTKRNIDTMKKPYSIRGDIK